MGKDNKTPKESYKRAQGPVVGHQSHTDSRVNDNRSQDRLNLSVDIVGNHGRHASQPNGQHGLQLNMNNARNSNYKKQVRDYSLRMSRINEDKMAELKKNGIDMSMHELSVNNPHGSSHSKSLMKA